MTGLGGVLALALVARWIVLRSAAAMFEERPPIPVPADALARHRGDRQWVFVDRNSGRGVLSFPDSHGMALADIRVQDAGDVSYFSAREDHFWICYEVHAFVTRSTDSRFDNEYRVETATWGSDTGMPSVQVIGPSGHGDLAVCKTRLIAAFDHGACVLIWDDRSHRALWDGSTQAHVTLLALLGPDDKPDAQEVERCVAAAKSYHGYRAYADVHESVPNAVPEDELVAAASDSRPAVRAAMARIAEAGGPAFYPRATAAFTVQRPK